MIVDPDFCDHWKTRMLVGSLDGDEAAPVYVLRLWAHCQNRRQSTFSNLSSEALKALCRFPGNANKLESSLVASGFVRREERDLIVCNWDEYNSSLIASWNNGRKGGRPSSKTQGKPTGKPTGLREDKRRVDGSREDKTNNHGRERSSHWKDEAFQAIWLDWVTHVGVVSKPLSEPAEEAALYDLEKFSTADAIEMVRYSLKANAKNLITNGDHKKPAKSSGVPQDRKQGFKVEIGSW